MWKFVLRGATLAGTAIATMMGLSLPLALAQTSPVTPSQCPSRPAWTQGYRFYELIPLGQSRQARVNNQVANVRRGAGFAAPIAFTLPQGSTVTITGETWDSGCNQWMQVITNQGSFWMHGNTLATGTSPPTTLTRVRQACPQAPWTEGYHLYELIALAEAQYRPSLVTGRSAPLRDGAGFDAREVGRLQRGTLLIVIGEAWDHGCNQWMRVQVSGDRHWIHGHAIQ
jgi:uncharacterized protein YraI